MIKKIQNLLQASSGRNSQAPNSVRAVSFILSVVLTTAGIGYAVAFAANTTIGNNIVTSGNLTVGGTTTFNTIAYTWPSADGSSGQVLSTNGAGVLSWAAGGGGSSLFTDGGATSYLTSTDNLGVGTTSTAFKLGVQGNALFSGDIFTANMTATGSLNITNGATGPAEIYLNTNGVNVALLGAHSDNSFDIFMNGMTPPAFFIGAASSGGYIGLATNTPSQRLSVQGSGFFSGDIINVANVTATGTITIGHSATTSTMLYVSDGTATGTPGVPGETQNLAWFVGNEANPTIGLESPSIGVSMGMVINTGDDNGVNGLFTTFTNHPISFQINSAADNAKTAMWISTNSNIGIGTTTPSEVLSVIGNIALSGNILPTLAPAVTASSSVPSASGKIDGTDFNAVPSGHALAIGIDGFPIIAYRNATDSSLKVTKCGDADCYAATTTSTVIGAGLVGEGDQSISIALGSDGLPWITYSQATDLSLHVVRCANTSCSATTSDLFVDGVEGGTPGPNVSTSTSIVIANDGNPKIAYYDETNGELRFANCSTVDSCASFSTSTLDGSGVTDVGAFNSMTVLPDDSIAISYYDVTNADLKMIKCKGPTCSGPDATTVDSTTSADVGKYTSIAIATDGMPIISYYDVANADLRVAKCLDFWCGTKSLYSIDSTGDVGQYSSITIGSDGFPIISYYDASNLDLKTAKCSNSTCSVANDRNSLYTSGDAGKYSSIAIGADGMPFTVFYSATDTDVRYFKCTGQNCHGTAAGYLVGGSDLGSLGKFFNNAYVESLWAKQIAIKRFDLAEDYYSQEDLNPGEIVSLDPSEALHIKKASNDGSRVIGIVSTEPALVLSDFTAPASNDKNYPIALAGRVPVKVNSEGGSIAIGDPIALSSVSGTGKRAAEGERSIGYALDAFAGVNGTIRVFVNLNGENSSVVVDSSESLLGQVIGVVKNWLSGLQIVIEDGILTVRDLVADRMTAKKLCLEDVCIDKLQLQAILSASGNPQPAAEVSAPVEDLTETPVEDPVIESLVDESLIEESPTVEPITEVFEDAALAETVPTDAPTESALIDTTKNTDAVQ